MNTTWIVIAVIAVLVVFLVSQYNRLIRLNVRVDEAFSQIEVQLQRRADLIPNLIETVKGYAAHETLVFQKVTTARAHATSAQGVVDVAAADSEVTNALRGLIGISEAYPDLKASANFISLQEELSTTENKIGFARQYYNDNVGSLNSAILAIPGKFFAGMANVTKREFYVVDDATKREVPQVNF